MNAKYTPGPWNRVAAIETERGMVYGINAWADVKGLNGTQDCRIAEVFSIEGNAKLVSCAPDLLNALELLCNAKRPLDWSPSIELVEAFAKARALLAKLGEDK